MTRTRKRIILIASVSVIVLAAAAAERGLSEKGERTRKATREDLVIGVDVRGTLFSEQSDSLTAPRLTDVWRYQISQMAGEGENVKKGDSVIGFDTQELARELQDREAERDSARKQIEKRQADLKLEREKESLGLEEARARFRKSELKLETPPTLMSVKELDEVRADHRISTEEIGHLEKRLHSIERAADGELLLLRAKLTRAEQRITELKENIASMTVRAPRDGMVVYVASWDDKKKKVGDNAWRGEPLVELPDLSHMRARGEIDEAEAGHITAGQSVTLRLDAHADIEIRGKIDRVGDSVRPESQTVPLKVLPVEITLQNAPAGMLKPGMRFRGVVELERSAAVIVVPLDAVFDSADGTVVHRKGLFGIRSSSVSLGKRNRDKVEVLEGVKPGDELLLRNDATTEEKP